MEKIIHDLEECRMFIPMKYGASLTEAIDILAEMKDVTRCEKCHRVVYGNVKCPHCEV